MQHLPKILRFGTERVLCLTDMITVRPLSTSVNAVSNIRPNYYYEATPECMYTMDISSTCFSTSYA